MIGLEVEVIRHYVPDLIGLRGIVTDNGRGPGLWLVRFLPDKPIKCGPMARVGSLDICQACRAEFQADSKIPKIEHHWFNPSKLKQFLEGSTFEINEYYLKVLNENRR